jgi:hypothetical protein
VKTALTTLLLPNIPFDPFRAEAKLSGTEADGKGQLIGMAVQPVFDVPSRSAAFSTSSRTFSFGSRDIPSLLLQL